MQRAEAVALGGQGWRNARGALRALVRFCRRKPLGAVGLVILLAAVAVAVLGPTLAPHDPYQVRSRAILQPPSAAFWFGTDILGRDIFSRAIYGARVSMYVGLMAVLLGTTTGSLLGLVSAYFGGKVDLIVQRFIDSLSAFPALLLAIAIMAVLGQSLNNIIIAVTIVWIPRSTRTIRSVALSVKEAVYVEAARAIGAGHLRLVFRHILPNCMAAYMVLGTASLGGVIIVEASLSFLGVGTPAHIISWGAMLSSDQLQYFAAAPWVGIFPGLTLSLVVFGVNVLGDALRDVLDPRLRGGR